ncbi:ParB/RepB/Spo0J family partition protein [Pseudodesulfovibrio piezophilus]|uniref:Uncharacterized protein n=1 Tax=Pseudodesulfovibrio piezophilus (strain DSM 21447 / JCM 15486 / C1TLV30) TaxID=1322246 RepID=M1WUF6_PSEP2|nr:ParB/RepB/Spo0J family partition protein [Pseudodesulfovibrio piezophilus]CCH47253.1 conserved protein of unknown function [Pseudodesulfovibrio piezophilus C1TLV30]
MQLSSEIITASAQAIQTTGSHLFWSEQTNTSLKTSLEEVGQTTPILVQETETGLELISGFARVMILKELGKPVLVRLVERLTDMEKGLLYLIENTHRLQDDGMKLKALRYFRTFTSEKEIRQTVLHRLGIKPKSKDAKLFMTWLELPENWQSHLTAGRIPLAAGTIIAKMNDSDRHAVEQLFTNYSWSRSNAVNVLTWLFETSKMTAHSIANIMNTTHMDTMMGLTLSPKDTIARLVSTAKKARYPELTSRQKSYAETSAKLVAGTKWQLEQPDNFETNEAELTLRIKNSQQLKTALHDLEDMVTRPEWEILWTIGTSHD